MGVFLIIYATRDTICYKIFQSKKRLNYLTKSLTVFELDFLLFLCVIISIYKFWIALEYLRMIRFYLINTLKFILVV